MNNVIEQDYTKTDLSSAGQAEHCVMRNDSRYPYTYCTDYLRMEVGDDYGRGLPSRAAMAQVRSLIAGIIGMDEHELACKIADKYLDKYGT